MALPPKAKAKKAIKVSDFKEEPKIRLHNRGKRKIQLYDKEFFPGQHGDWPQSCAEHLLKLFPKEVFTLDGMVKDFSSNSVSMDAPKPLPPAPAPAEKTPVEKFGEDEEGDTSETDDDETEGNPDSAKVEVKDETVLDASSRRRK